MNAYWFIRHNAGDCMHGFTSTVGCASYGMLSAKGIFPLFGD
jgi:hypothetical protein